MTEYEILHSSFDIEIHQKTFIGYLEVVILKNGTVEYAVPGHQEKLIALAMKELNATRNEIADMCPPEFYLDYNVWLASLTDTLCVWNDFYQGIPNEKQIETLHKLKEAKLYFGKI